MKRLLLLAAVAALTLSACNKNDTFISPTDPKIAYSGRIDMTDTTSLAFTFPGVAAEICFDAPAVTMATTPGAGSFMVEIDDRAPFKISLGENDSIVCLADSLTDGEHRLRVSYAMEGHDNHPAFRGFYLADGGRLTRRPDEKKLKIEFIGNSITCGYGLETDDPEEHFTYDTENHYYTYAAQTARNLNADYNVVARSGIGVYRNYNGSREGNDEMTMRDIYGRTLYDRPDPQWDFSRFTPDIVCLNLGTNDTSLDNYDTELMTAAYRDMVSRIRKVYPDARIVLLTGSMLQGKALEDVKTMLDSIAGDARAQGDLGIYRFDMTPQDGTLGYGADWHPSRRQADKMAAELTGFLKTIID